MSNKKSIYPQVDSKYEFLVFLEFVEKATGWARGKVPHLDSFYSKNGIAGITNEPIYIYFESYSEIRWHHAKYSKTKRAFIRLGKEHLKHDNLIDESIDYADNIILGPRFFLSLAEKNPELWWLFVASCSEKPRVVVDKDGKTLTLTAEKMPCIFNLINIIPTLARKRINELSNIFKEDFIYQRKHSKETYVVLGNGVSIPFGSDLWNQLSDYLFDFLTPQYVENGPLVKKAIGNSTFSTTSISKTIINPDKYNDAIWSCVYRKYEKSMHLRNTLLREIALSKMRDEDLKIVSYNYDEFLEIEYNDFCNSLVKIRPVCNAKEDARIAEPKIKHIHGFISLDKRIKKNLVLTQEEYYKTYKNNNWVVKTQEAALKSNCLFVGSSMSDLFQMSIINKVRESYYKSDTKKYLFTYPWKCYALLCFKDLNSKDIATLYTYYLNKGIRIIFTKSFDELPEAYNSLIS